MSGQKLIAVTKLSRKGTSIRMTLPHEIAKIVDVEEGGHIGFYLDGGKVVLKKIE